MNFETKIDRFPVDESQTCPEELQKAFDTIDSYKESIKPYIYTGIDIMHDLDDKPFFQSRVQLAMSNALLRSLFLKEGAVVALNNNNLPALYAILKSLVEIPAVLGYVVDLLNREATNEELLELFTDLTLGNRESGPTKVSLRTIPNVMTMFGKLEKELKKIFPPQTDMREDMVSQEKIMLHFYEEVCNYGHPNYDASTIVGGLDKVGVWHATDATGLASQKARLFNGYKPAFITAILITRLMCDVLVKHPKIDNFSALTNPLYFN